MSRLAEIKAAIDLLTPEQQQEIATFIVALRHETDNLLPPPRDLSPEQIQQWIADNQIQ